MAYRVQDMTWEEVEERIRECPAAVVPLGSTEQHGYHLPLGTDTYLAETLADMVSEKSGALVYPGIHFSYSWSWRDRTGTVAVRQQILQETLKDVARSVERYGIRALVFLNGHEANGSTMKYAVREIQDETDVKVLGMFYPGLSEIYEKYMETPTWGGMFHACEFETSLMLAARADFVHMDRARAEYPPKLDFYGMDNTSIGDLSISGTYGDPTKATKEKGEKMLEEFSGNIAELIAKALDR